MLLNERKQKKSLLRHSKNLKAIHDDYYLKREYANVEYDQNIKRTKHDYYASGVVEKYGLTSYQELYFLLHYYAGEKVKDCEFCGQVITRVMKQNGDYHYNDCQHIATCIMCDKPRQYGYINHGESVCYSCKPPRHRSEIEEDLNDNERMRYLFLKMTGDHDRLVDLNNIEIAKKMMEIASYYYHWFEEIKNKLIEAQQ